MFTGVAHGVKRKLAIAVSVALVCAPPALAAKPAPGSGHGGGGSGGGGGGGGGSASTGYDISYPQCTTGFPSSAAFGIVGVNGGLANDANQCLSAELGWALATPGLPSQPSVSFYINTADPGPAPGVSDWPSAGSDSYGSCDGAWSTACAYIYGEARAAYSYGLVSATPGATPATTPWWLDIETGNSWATSSTSGYQQLNIATIQGFIAGLQSSGALGAVGIYSSASQWTSITGLTPSGTATGLGLASPPPAWIAGPRSSLRMARSNCSSTGFTGAIPTLAQYSSGGYDADLRCA